MPWVNRIFSFYIHGSIHVALALLAFLFYTLELTGTELHFSYVITLFFGTVAGYNAIKWGVEPWRNLPASFPSRGILIFSFICGIIALISAMDLSLQYWILLGIGVFLAALYALPILPGFRNLRSFGKFKVNIVTLVWVHVTVLIPLWDSSPFLNWDILVEVLQRCFWVSLLMLPFEIRDMETDPVDLLTWPRRWGKQKTIGIVWVSAVIFFFLTFLKDSYLHSEVISKAFAAIAMIGAVIVSYGKKPRNWASFYVEAIPMVSLLLFLSARGFLGE